MHKFNDRKKLLRLFYALLLILISTSGCTMRDSATPSAVWLSVSEAELEAARNRKPIEIAVKGHFVEFEQGKYLLRPIDVNDKPTDSIDFLVIEGDSVYVARVLADCVGENVIVTGMLYGGNPTVVRATDIDELDDVRKLSPGTCDQ